MKLKSYGCSTIWGSELRDCGDQTRTASRLTWPARLSQHLGMQYQCHAWPGRGNFFIANQVLDQLATAEPTLHVVNWTWIDRFDFFDESNKSSWDTLRPDTMQRFGGFYYRNLHSELSDKLRSLQLIKLVTLELLAAQQPFIMTYMDDLIWDQRWHTTPAMCQQQQFLQPLMQHWFKPGHDPMNWSLWAVLQGHAVTKYNHLLESGHELVFTEVLRRLKAGEISTVSQLAIDKIKTA